MKVDRGLTCIRSGFQAGRHVQQAKAMRQLLGDEVLVHLAFTCTREGAMNCSSLQLIRCRSDERLNPIMQIGRDRGVYIADPYVYIVEDGKPGQVNPDVVATKMRVDPAGRLNPGKPQYCSDTKHRRRLMPLVQQFASMADAEVAHLALDAARVEAPAAADASSARDLLEQRVAPRCQALRGERPRLAASCA
jgi:hypothetical protein